MKLKLIYIITILLLLVSCEKSFDFNNTYNLNIVVIEGIITNQYINQTIKITKLLNNANDSLISVNNAIVKITDGTHIYTFTENDSLPGVYQSDTKFIAVIDKIYTLTVNINDTIYKATTAVYPVVPFDSLQFAFDTSQNLYYIKYVAPVFATNQSAMYKISIDWSNVSGYENLPLSQTQALTYFYTLKTLDINELFGPPKEQIYFPKGTAVKVEKYSLTPEFEDFIRRLLLESQWAGSIFDIQHGFMSTNIQGGALGFFTGSSVYKKTFTVE